jgi:hypothetical protein
MAANPLMATQELAGPMHYEVSLIVKVPRGKAYSAYTDFGSASKWSKAKDVRVSDRQGDVVHLQSGGGTRTMRLFPQERVESTQESRLAKTRSVVRFEDVPEGTKVTASLDVDFKGRWGLLFKTQPKPAAESSALEELRAFASYAESL